MELFSREFGTLGANCYVLGLKKGLIVIDPGAGAAEWILSLGKTILAILATHGHFDHIFDADELREKTGAKIYLPSGDEILTKSDPFGLLIREFKPDFLVNDGEKLYFGEAVFTYRIFPGHTPGCAMIELNLNDERIYFSGDFIFKNSVGRSDFTYGDPLAMKESLRRALALPDAPLYPGHGAPTSLANERENIRRILED